MRETQTSADRVDKLRDIEETPQLLLLAPGHFTTPGERNIRVDKEADIPELHWGELPVQWEGIWLTNDVLRGMRRDSLSHMCWSHLGITSRFSHIRIV